MHQSDRCAAVQEKLCILLYVTRCTATMSFAYALCAPTLAIIVTSTCFLYTVRIELGFGLLVPYQQPLFV